LLNVLVFNPGSGSLKFELVDVEARDPARVDGRSLIRGVIEPIGKEGTFSAYDSAGNRIARHDAPVIDYAEAARAIAAWEFPEKLHALAFRVVHGGTRYTEPVRIDSEFLADVESLNELAPLHNPACLAVIRAASASFPAGTPALAVFDSAFHRTIPEYAYTYALPYELAQRHGIRRYGFHGISHHYLALRYAELQALAPEQTTIVTLHLEGGSSAAAIRNGRSVDTSMGVTPLEGLVMGTRCGDLDPAVVGLLARRENASLETVERWLTKESGLLGLSGRSQDTRVLAREETHDARARLALDVFSYRVKKYVSAYLGVLDGATAVVFAGGIGENTPSVRERICSGLEHLGLRFDAEANARVIDRIGCISREGSPVQVWVIPTQEGLMMAHLAAGRLRRG
jgi:acetate kinase